MGEDAADGLDLLATTTEVERLEKSRAVSAVNGKNCQGRREIKPMGLSLFTINVLILQLQLMMT